jgi:restriction system protein
MPNDLTINEAILAVMKSAGTPLTPREAYDRIIAADLYSFHAQRPANVVVGQIRRHCKDIDFPTAEQAKYFAMTPDGKFYPLVPLYAPRAGGGTVRSRNRRPRVANLLFARL